MTGFLRLEGVVGGYGGGDVLQGVDLEVERGSITCIVGPNGAGKSTVLRTLSGLLRPRLGRIELEGSDITGAKCGEVLRQGIVQVPQSNGIFPQMTVRENVLMGGYPIRRDRGLTRRRFAEVEDLFPIVAERGHEKAGNLSGGQRRQVEFARPGGRLPRRDRQHRAAQAEVVGEDPGDVADGQRHQTVSSSR